MGPSHADGNEQSHKAEAEQVGEFEYYWCAEKHRLSDLLALMCDVPVSKGHFVLSFHIKVKIYHR